MLLAFSSRDRLGARFGTEGFDRVAATLDAYSYTLNTNRVANRIVFIDDAADMRQYSLPPVELDTWRDATAGVRGVVQALEIQGFDVNNVVVVGGHRIIPFCDLPNPAAYRSIDRDQAENIPMSITLDRYEPYGDGLESHPLAEQWLGMDEREGRDTLRRRRLHSSEVGDQGRFGVHTDPPVSR